MTSSAARCKRPTDEDEVRIQAGIADDSDTRIVRADEIKRMRAFSVVSEEVRYAAITKALEEQIDSANAHWSHSQIVFSRFLT